MSSITKEGFFRHTKMSWNKKKFTSELFRSHPRKSLGIFYCQNINLASCRNETAVRYITNYFFLCDVDQLFFHPAYICSSSVIFNVKSSGRMSMSTQRTPNLCFWREKRRGNEDLVFSAIYFRIPDS